MRICTQRQVAFIRENGQLLATPAEVIDAIGRHFAAILHINAFSEPFLS